MHLMLSSTGESTQGNKAPRWPLNESPSANAFAVQGHVPMFDYTLPDCAKESQESSRVQTSGGVDDDTTGTRCECASGNALGVELKNSLTHSAQWTNTWLENVLNYNFTDDLPASLPLTDGSIAQSSMNTGPGRVFSHDEPHTNASVGAAGFPIGVRSQNVTTPDLGAGTRSEQRGDVDRQPAPWDPFSASPGAAAPDSSPSAPSTTIHNMWGLILALEAGGSSVHISASLMRQLLRAAGQGDGAASGSQPPER